jgi:dihydropteroate synthase
MISEIPLSPTGLQCRHGFLDLARPAVMGILNLTPDSFHAPSRITDIPALLKQAEQMLAEGASLLDLGAASSRPGAAGISVEEELSRLIPALSALRNAFPKTILSVDTFQSAVASRALDEGGDLINDISGGWTDPSLLKLVAREEVPYILMHMQGSPADMQHNPSYTDVTEEVLTWFRDRISRLQETGIQQVILDPGFGFGKTVAHNYELLKHLYRFCSLGFPVLAGISRKSMITRVLHNKNTEALNGTTAAHMLALLNGARLLRVHDVQEAVEAIRIFEQYQNPAKTV